MTPAWAAAVEASETAVRRLANQPKNKPLLVAFGRLLHEVRHGSPGDMTIAEAAFWEVLDERDRAALPHALRAVVEGMDSGDLGRVWAMGAGYWHSTRDMPKPVVGPATGAATGMCFPDQMRTALLAALTDAAGRVG